MRNYNLDRFGLGRISFGNKNTVWTALVSSLIRTVIWNTTQTYGENRVRVEPNPKGDIPYSHTDNAFYKSWRNVDPVSKTDAV